ncbi:UNVERIFIED_CONTAM: hypothetical protein PYX00_008392 [Menopon gallinae]
MMTGLTKLHLCNNIIEEIENIEMLTELKELDLSFNNIQKIKNLETLTKLEVLTLFENKIEVVENLDHLKKLTVLSVGNNKISEFDNVIYLRGFQTLKSLNMAGNPVCEDPHFLQHIIAYLPQLKYYEYRMISPTQKEESRTMYLKDLKKLEREENRLKEIRIAREKEEEAERINEIAFVEGLRGGGLFNQMFENDPEGRTLLLIGDSAHEVYNEFKKLFCETSNEIIALGLQQEEIRRAEIEEYEAATKLATEQNYLESRKIVEDFHEEKQKIVGELKSILVRDDDDESVPDITVSFHGISESFQELCLRTWTSLMKKELYFYESCEEVNSTFERNLTEMVNQFIEQAQSAFTQLRQYQGLFHENLSDVANKFFTAFAVAASGAAESSKEMLTVAAELQQFMQDREVLMNALATSHDLHMLMIDQREDKLVSRVRSWLANLVDNIVK